MRRPSQALSQDCCIQSFELIVPYRENNKERRYEDGRKLRRYLRRWIVERTNAWLGQFRRLLVRHEHMLSTYYAYYAPEMFLKYALISVESAARN
jgi:hypothetical protein